MSSKGLESMPTDSGVPYRNPSCLQLSLARVGDAAAKKAATITKSRMVKVVAIARAMQSKPQRLGAKLRVGSASRVAALYGQQNGAHIPRPSSRNG